MPLPEGTRIGPYEVIGWIGAGGMGDVYRARDPRLGREVAIKLIRESFAADRGRVHRFEQEARAAGQLNHPNVLAVHDLGTHAGAPYIVSELLEGTSLRQRLEGGALPLAKAVDVARQMADGLAAAHDKGIVHRDLKPDNVFVTSDGRIKILDFGIAKLTGPTDDAARPTGFPTETAEGTVLGTAGYMSPEQVRGEAVDVRSDLFSVGAILYEMLSGRRAFVRPTAAETVAAVLKEEPIHGLPGTVPPALARVVARCLEKEREARVQSARDLAFDLKLLSETRSGLVFAKTSPDLVIKTLLVTAVVVVGVLAAAVAWPRSAPPGAVNPLPGARFSLLTNWEGNEEGAEISPNGELVAFLSDAEGEFDLMVSQIGSGFFPNLTRDLPALASSGVIVRKLGFSGDGSQIWFNPGDGQAPAIIPWAGGNPRAFLPVGTNTPAWSPDGTRLVYVDKAKRDDPIYVADASGANATPIVGPGPLKNMNPVWSLDSEWIYFARGAEPQDETGMDVWRVRASGGQPEQVTRQHLPINFLTPVDSRRMLYVARDEDRSGPWLWVLDVTTGTSARVPSGADQYMSVSASRDGRRIVATVANPSSRLWQVPIVRGTAEESAARPYVIPLATGHASAPRFGKASLFLLAARGTGDGLWRVRDGRASQVRRNVDGALAEPAAVSPTGERLALVVRKQGRRSLSVMDADGTNAQTLAPSIDIDGAAGQSAVDWSPDGSEIVLGGHDDKGPALFVVSATTGAVRRLIDGTWVNPIWSPRGDMIVYAGRSLIGQVELRAIRPDGTAVALPQVLVRPGGYRFLPDGSGLVFLERIPSLDFSLFDFATAKARQLTRLANQGALRTFDVTPDGRSIVFDRARQQSNIVLIELPR